MIIGVPKEIKNNENRVGLTPAGVAELRKNGHSLFVQASAGEGSGFTDAEYEAAGATMLSTIADVYKQADMIIKVKEPIAEEYPLIKENQLLFTYFHFASGEELTHAMIERKAICLAYETVETPSRALPLLIPMSEVAGRMAPQEGAKWRTRREACARACAGCGHRGHASCQGGRWPGRASNGDGYQPEPPA
uniref:NAD(P) mitochondrial isoform A n=1 Tax=Tanacetum cinerariifolium TaxID=118510 RepID=A0A699RIX4_TANCI|nr:NAD(P) mitochondrial isoform A [Tanacetum cinerariifolium]